MGAGSSRFWRTLMLVSAGFAVVGLISLAGLRRDISGDGVPNRPQKGPPVEYNWSKAVPIAFLTCISAGTAVYSLKKIS